MSNNLKDQVHRLIIENRNGSDDKIDVEEQKGMADEIIELIKKSNQALLDRVERELPEKTIKVETGESVNPENIRYFEARGYGYVQAIDQTKATIDRMRGEL